MEEKSRYIKPTWHLSALYSSIFTWVFAILGQNPVWHFSRKHPNKPPCNSIWKQCMIPWCSNMRRESIKVGGRIFRGHFAKEEKKGGWLAHASALRRNFCHCYGAGLENGGHKGRRLTIRSSDSIYASLAATTSVKSGEDVAHEFGWGTGTEI